MKIPSKEPFKLPLGVPVRLVLRGLFRFKLLVRALGLLGEDVRGHVLGLRAFRATNLGY